MNATNTLLLRKTATADRNVEQLYIRESPSGVGFLSSKRKTIYGYNYIWLQIHYVITSTGNKQTKVRNTPTE